MSNHVRISGETATHLVNWQNSNSGQTFCGIDFWRVPNGQDPEYVWPVATTVVDDCDCMTCLVRENRAIGFLTYQTVGETVVNIGAIRKLNFDKE